MASELATFGYIVRSDWMVLQRSLEKTEICYDVDPSQSLAKSASMRELKQEAYR